MGARVWFWSLVQLFWKIYILQGHGSTYDLSQCLLARGDGNQVHQRLSLCLGNQPKHLYWNYDYHQHSTCLLWAHDRQRFSHQTQVESRFSALFCHFRWPSHLDRRHHQHSRRDRGIIHSCFRVIWFCWWSLFNPKNWLYCAYSNKTSMPLNDYCHSKSKSICRLNLHPPWPSAWHNLVKWRWPWSRGDKPPDVRQFCSDVLACRWI